ncbi:MAG: hypothetical protein D6796_01480 [Caldilineae bacterium]|nr:MAG: hypothetical protein D6796_01480 [Caldilineae bacterium]
MPGKGHYMWDRLLACHHIWQAGKPALRHMAGWKARPTAYGRLESPPYGIWTGWKPALQRMDGLEHPFGVQGLPYV